MTSAEPVSVNATELHNAFEFVSAGAPYEHSVYISMDTGKIHWVSNAIELEEELPEDLETSDRYMAVPDKNELDLGRDLVLSFIDQELPDDYNAVAGFFRRKGAYSRFKQLLEFRGMLQRWYDYENRATEEALLSWCEENGIQLVDG